MPERCALVLDSDARFSTLVERALRPSGLKVHVLGGGGSDGAIERIVHLRPELVFVAVDLPERAGFGICNRTKSLLKSARVVLATSTIPWREMELHQKLKIHADLYLDKRQVSENELSRQIEGLLGTPAAPAEESGDVRPQPEPERELPPEA